MTTIPPTAIDELPTTESASNGLYAGFLRGWNWVESRLAALADRANPILVKETRQALKSRQFVVTFLIVLIGCWIVSFVGVAMVGPQIYFAAAGPGMLAAYYTILIIPLSLIVPFTAFRSLAAEQEENTFDLLSITTLGSRQIVTGKLMSALVQMVVYMSAVIPCIAFTFLLRGVDALTVTMLLAIAVFGCVGLSMISLLIGAAARVRNTQVVVSVVLVLLLAACGWGLWGMGMVVISNGSSDFLDPTFWLICVGLAGLYVTTFGLLHAAAAAQIAFVSENRSTPLRWWMMLQQGVLCGWLGGIGYAFWQDQWMGFRNTMSELLLIASTLGGVYWFFMGSMMTGEWPHLSRRVQRSLPTSDRWRPFISLLNPGPGSGYLFAVANLTMLVLLGIVGVWVAEVSIAGGGGGRADRAIYFAIFTWSYVVAFLGFGRLIINAARQWAFVPMTAGFLIHIILLLAAIGVPTVIQMTSRELRTSGYTLLQTSNPAWTLSDLARKGPGSVQSEILIFILPAAAFLALLLNLRSVATELLLQKIPVPVRILEDEAEQRAAAPRGPSNPWDADDEEAAPG